MRQSPTILLLAAVMGLLGVLAGTFGAHALRDRIAVDLLETFETGVRYHLVHAVAMLAIAAVAANRPGGGKALAWAAWQFAAGIATFSGSLYALTISGERSLGMITPFGGVLFLSGWVTLASAVFVKDACNTGGAPGPGGLPR